MRRFFVVYLLVVLAAWVVPSGLGHDVTRVRLLALPLVLLLAALRRWRPLPVVVAAVLLAAVWNIQPLASQWRASAADGSRAAKVWTAPVAWLHAHLEPGYRVEAVDTSQHWPAYYLAGEGIPLARGWFRQDDFPFNQLLYAPSLDYVELRRRGCTDSGSLMSSTTRFPLDHTAVAEDAMVTTTLHRVFRTPDVSIYRVPHARSIVSGGARVLALAPGEPRAARPARGRLSDRDSLVGVLERVERRDVPHTGRDDRPAGSPPRRRDGLVRALGDFADELAERLPVRRG